MSNVYTKRSNLPRNTTHSDFGYKSRNYVSKQKLEREVPRAHSPTRRANPQPLGLNYQQPYNRKLQWFGIWNPNIPLTNERRKDTFGHLSKTNFSCRHDPELLANRLRPSLRRGSLPATLSSNMRSVSDTIQRESYQWPEDFPDECKDVSKFTRFGYSPKFPVVGIVPSALASYRIPPIVDKNTTVEYIQEQEAKRKEIFPKETPYLALNRNILSKT